MPNVSLIGFMINILTSLNGCKVTLEATDDDTIWHSRQPIPRGVLLCAVLEDIGRRFEQVCRDQIIANLALVVAGTGTDNIAVDVTDAFFDYLMFVWTLKRFHPRDYLFSACHCIPLCTHKENGRR